MSMLRGGDLLGRQSRGGRIGGRRPRPSDKDGEAGNGEADNQAESDEQCGFHEPCLYAIRIGSIRSRGSRRRILDRNKERTH